MKRIILLVPAILSAVLLWAAFPPMGETSSIVFALAPLLVVSRLCTPKKALWLWFLGGFLFWFATLSWMPAVSKNNGPLPLVILGWMGLAALCAGYFALYGWLAARAWRRLTDFGRPALKLLGVVLMEPILWAGVEWLRGWLFTGFAWNYLGTAIGRLPSLLTPARLGGVYLVSALVLLLNGVFATVICRLLAQMRIPGIEGLDLWVMGGRNRLVRMLETALPLGLILFVFWLSTLSIPRQADPTSRRLLRVALVQRNAPCVFAQRDPNENPVQVFSRLLAPAMVANPDLIVWAESAMDEFGRLGGAGAQKAAKYFSDQTGGASLLAGGGWSVKAENGESHHWNAAGLYTPVGTNMELQVYGKQHLVPFGEFIPLDKWIPALQKLSPIGVSLWPGEPKVLDLVVRDGEKVKIAPLICFEDTDPSLARRAAELGAQAIVLITNDSWFSHSQETVQHSWQAVMRAVETGLPVIRVGNSGVTGVIYPSGRTRWLEDEEGSPLVDAQGMKVETVPVDGKPVATPYTRVGDVPLLALFLLAVVGTFVKMPVKRREEVAA